MVAFASVWLFRGIHILPDQVGYDEFGADAFPGFWVSLRLGYALDSILPPPSLIGIFGYGYCLYPHGTSLLCRWYSGSCSYSAMFESSGSRPGTATHFHITGHAEHHARGDVHGTAFYLSGLGCAGTLWSPEIIIQAEGLDLRLSPRIFWAVYLPRQRFGDMLGFHCRVCEAVENWGLACTLAPLLRGGRYGCLHVSVQL